MSQTRNSFRYFAIKIIFLLTTIVGLIFFIENNSILPSHSNQVSIYFLDSSPQHTKRTRSGRHEVITPAMWKAYILLEGKNVVCDISSDLYMKLKNNSNNQRVGLLHYHHAFFSDKIVCEKLEALVI